jgi:hypothetical protein
VIVGGCCVLVAIFRELGFDECLVSEADILDGLVLSQLAARLAAQPGDDRSDGSLGRSARTDR